MQPLVGLMMMFSVLVPTKIWYAPSQPLTMNLKAAGDVTLVLTDFSGKTIAKAAAPGASFDVKQVFPATAGPGVYLLFAASKSYTDGWPADFQGTPVVIETRSDKRQGAPGGPIVTKVEPLRYAEITTDAGKMTCMFYYDVAPNTVDNFLSLAEGGFYDGLIFHRVMAGFMIQGGDPLGDGTGGPGYMIGQEFSARPHKEGALSMARSEDVDSAGSQFFICLDYNGTRQLDGKYTVFGMVTDGFDAVKKIGATPTDPANNRPTTAQTIQKIEVISVTKDHNPYGK